MDLAQTVARAETTVLIRGERGVGKELLARYIHDDSRRAEGPFVAINCGSLPEPLLERELFGQRPGPHADETVESAGLFAVARGGTIFLDEIGETTAATQLKLLRALQEREIRPVGGAAVCPIDVRIIAATDTDLRQMVAAGSFRKDLYYRLEVVEIEIPPLRDRREDIVPLARDFVAQLNGTRTGAPLALSSTFLDALTAYSWPGNVRELHSAIERAAVFADEDGQLAASNLPPAVRDEPAVAPELVVGQVISLDELERRYILEVLSRNDGNRTNTARALGIGANTLWRKLKSWGIPSPRDPLA